MANIPNPLARLQRLMPGGVQPKFTTVQEWQTWQNAEGRKHAHEVNRRNQRLQLENIPGRTRIQGTRSRCTFARYQVNHGGHKHALTMARSYVHNFGSGCAGFVFSGNPGTGKRHLATAMGKHLEARGKTVLLLTFPELTQLLASHGSGGVEPALLADLHAADLLVLDTTGTRLDNSPVWPVTRDLICSRLSSKKPTGLLTSVAPETLCNALGRVLVERLNQDGAMWIKFDWGRFCEPPAALPGGSSGKVRRKPPARQHNSSRYGG